MLRKIVLATILSFVGFGCSYAGAYIPKVHEPIGYFYGGAFLSSDFSRIDTNTQTSMSLFENQNNSSQSPIQNYKYDWSAAGINGGLFAGYNFVFHHNYNLGIEAFAEASSLKENFNGAYNLFSSINNLTQLYTFKSEVKVPYTIGLSILPGYQVSHGTILLGRIGWVYSKFKYNTKASFSLIQSSSAIRNLPGATNRISEYKSGLQLGLGMSVMATENLGVRMEYDWSDYGTLSKSAGPVLATNTPTGPITTETSSKLKPSIEQFRLSVFYRPDFDAIPTHLSGGKFGVAMLHHHDGFYFGLFGSRDMADTQLNATHTLTLIEGGDSFPTVQPTSFDWNGEGFDGGAFIGYRLYFQNRYVLAFELFGDASSLQGCYTAANNFASSNGGFEKNVTKGKFRLRNSFGVSILPGIMLTKNTTLFSRIGWIDSHFNYNEASTFFINEPPSANNLSFTGPKLDINKYKSGLELGLGLSTMLNHFLALRMEYDVSFYGSMKKSIGPTSIAHLFNGVANYTSASSVKLKPVVSQFTVAFIYHFYS